MKSGKLTASKSTTKRTNKWLNLLEHYEWAVVILIFLATIGIFFAINNYSHAMTNFFDEYYYLEIAKSIWHGTGIRIRDIPFGFQNILYSAIIAPFMGITDPILRIDMLTLFNTFLFTSSIIPIWLITRKLKLGLPYRYLALLLAIVSPMQVYSTSYMTEILYYPMIIWFVYVWLVNQEKKQYWISFLIGVFCYTLFLCKEIAIFPLIIIILFELFYPLIEKILDRDSHCSFSDYYHWKNLINPVLYLVGFFLFFTIFKLTIFKGIGEFYQQTDPSAINSIGKFFYLIYSFIYFILGISLLACFIPIIYPFFCYKKMSKQVQYTFAFSILMIVIAAATCAYAVSVREDLIYDIFNPIAPRVIARYSMPAIMLLFIVLLYTFENKEIFLLQMPVGKRKGALIFLLILLGVFVLVFKGAPLDALSGTIMPSYYVHFQDFVNNCGINNPFLRYSLFVIFNLLIAGIVILLNHLLLFKEEKHLHKINITLIAVSLFATLICYEQYYTPRYYANRTTINEMVQVENFLNSIDANCTALWPCESSRELARYSTTYISDMRKVMIVDYKKIDETLPYYPSKTIRVTDITFIEPLRNLEYEQKDSIEYFIIPNDVHFSKVIFANVEIIPEYSMGNFRIYRNLKPKYITIQ